ncbi:uncharacterized protein LOC135122350 [Zophobas morio]|uniref:uncharacterized protein LOC135122350 n=1 Tax=Zophobas morio TaxID=2755281 RepID=UPI003083DDEA
MKDIVASQLPFEDEAKITETFMVYEANATTVEVANLLEIYFFSKEKFGDDHFLCILMERMLMEMAIQYGQQDSFLEINCELVKHFYKRIEELFMNISPIAGALLLQPFITNHLVDLDDQEIKSISKRFLYYFKLRFGENDADVQIWSSSI